MRGVQHDINWSDSSSAQCKSIRHWSTDSAEHVESPRLLTRFRIPGHWGVAATDCVKFEAAEQLCRLAHEGVGDCWEQAPIRGSLDAAVHFVFVARVTAALLNRISLLFDTLFSGSPSLSLFGSAMRQFLHSSPRSCSKSERSL